MNPEVLTIIATGAAVLSLVACYFPRIPAAVLALGSLACTFWGDWRLLGFWAVATAIVLGLRIIQPPATATRGNGFVATGSIAGALLGFVASPTGAGVILGSAAGAFLGAVAFVRMPKGDKIPLASRAFSDYFCSKGLPAIVACSMAAISLSQTLL